MFWARPRLKLYSNGKPSHIYRVKHGARLKATPAVLRCGGCLHPAHLHFLPLARMVCTQSVLSFTDRYRTITRTVELSFKVTSEKANSSPRDEASKVLNALKGKLYVLNSDSSLLFTNFAVAFNLNRWQVVKKGLRRKWRKLVFKWTLSFY